MGEVAFPPPLLLLPWLLLRLLLRGQFSVTVPAGEAGAGCTTGTPSLAATWPSGEGDSSWGAPSARAAEMSSGEGQ